MRTRKAIAGCVVLVGLMAWWANERFDSVLASVDEHRISNVPAQDLAVATVDIAELFKRYGKFQEGTAALKKQIALAEVLVKERQRERDRLQARLKEATPGTDDYRRWRAEVDKLTSDLSREVESQKKEFQQKEAALFYEAYQTVGDRVAQYCKSRGIRLVLRFNNQPVDPEEAQTVLQLVNRPIVYQEGLDITDAIVTALNEKMPANRE
jgi:Skp family chaperone for outer membrane proteins